jgi:hypothetical protein
MTLQTSRLNATVEEMLLEAGQEQDTALRAALLSLGCLGSLPAPPPNAQLAALLGARPDELSWRRRLRRHRPAIVGLVVVAGMGLGVTGVAASASRPAEQASASLQQLLGDWAPSWSVSGLQATAPAAGLVPGPAVGAQQAASESTTPDGQQESPVRGPAGQPVDQPEGQEAGPAGAARHDAGTGTGDEPGSAAGAKAGGAKAEADTERADTERADTERADTEPGDKKPKVPAEASTLLDNAKESAGQALAETGKVLSGALPAGKNADSGAKWLKKFTR